jgi:hypothetical protein
MTTNDRKRKRESEEAADVLDDEATVTPPWATLLDAHLEPSQTWLKRLLAVRHADNKYQDWRGDKRTLVLTKEELAAPASHEIMLLLPLLWYNWTHDTKANTTGAAPVTYPTQGPYSGGEPDKDGNLPFSLRTSGQIRVGGFGRGGWDDSPKRLALWGPASDTETDKLLQQMLTDLPHVFEWLKQGWMVDTPDNRHSFAEVAQDDTRRALLGMQSADKDAVLWIRPSRGPHESALWNMVLRTTEWQAGSYTAKGAKPWKGHLPGAFVINLLDPKDKGRGIFDVQTMLFVGKKSEK